MEAHPALRLTPDALAYQVRQASEAAQQQGRRELANAVQRVDAAGADLERYSFTSIGPRRTPSEIRRLIASERDQMRCSARHLSSASTSLGEITS
jgi:hypothetical protein